MTEILLQERNGHTVSAILGDVGDIQILHGREFVKVHDFERSAPVLSIF